MIFDPNPLFFEMVKIYDQYKTDNNKIIIMNEGGSRSSKTWDFFHLLVAICTNNKNLDVYILRDTLVNCRDFTLKEFTAALTVMGIFDERKLKSSPKPFYNLFDNNIYFRGLDDEKNQEGYPSDIVFINEALETEKAKVDGIIMRCRRLVVMDWNPKFTRHWCFDMQKRSDTFFTHSTYKNNRHLQESVRKAIEAYEPTPENIANGTADIFRWKVYGLGERAVREGLVYPDVTWIDSFPDNAGQVYYGMDYGYTIDPTVIGKVSVVGRRIYAECLCYEPINNVFDLDKVMQVQIADRKADITADSADMIAIGTLREMGWNNITPARKPPGSVEQGIEIIKRYELYFVKHDKVKQEHENYMYKIVNGMNTGVPVDKFNHFWDQLRYVMFMNFRYHLIENE